MPAFHGFYRAISSTSYCWTLPQWVALTSHLKSLCSVQIIDRLNRLAADLILGGQVDEDTFTHIKTFVTRYVAQGRPLSGHFMVCCVLETEWTVLAQVLAPPGTPRGQVIEAAAANKAWIALTRQAAVELDIEAEGIRQTLKDTVKYALQCFTDLLVQMEEMDSEPSIDTCAWETLSESLVRDWVLATSVLYPF